MDSVSEFSTENQVAAGTFAISSFPKFAVPNWVRKRSSNFSQKCTKMISTNDYFMKSVTTMFLPKSCSFSLELCSLSLFPLNSSFLFLHISFQMMSDRVMYGPNPLVPTLTMSILTQYLSADSWPQSLFHHFMSHHLGHKWFEIDIFSIFQWECTDSVLQIEAP